MTSITSTSPGTGEVLGQYPVMDDAAVRTAVDRARIAARWWADLGWAGRRARLMAFKNVLARRAEEVAELVHREGGKPVDDALLEVVLSVEHLDWAARQARRVLAERPVRPSLLTINQRATLSYEPVGVVGVIGPWNYPVFTPIGSVGYALAAGNAVVFKPSEWTTAVGAWLVERFAEVVPEQPVWQLITGDGSTGAALCTAGTDTIAFTGSTAVGKKIMAACAPTLTPVVLECGGKDAVLVDADADIAKAADAVAFGAFSNAGQTCVSTERAYVHEAVYDEFVAALADIARRLQPGSGDGASYGPMTMPSQVDIVRRHIDDALARGGCAVVGGPESAMDRVVTPVVLTGVPEDSAAVVEETFGPTIVVNRVRDLDEAVDHANASSYGLAAAIFGRNRARCEAAARRLRVGMVSINSWSMNAGVPALPWGGVGESGIGRIHGEDGLRAFARPKAMVSERFPLPFSLTSFDRPADAGRLLAGVIRVLHGGAPWRR
jgi:acyl-CoA reductase-like NAD-dependent aldehyde dehydrogenase